MTKLRDFATVEDVYTALTEGAKITDRVSWSHVKKTKGQSVRMSIGRIFFNLLLPNEYELVDEPVTKKKLSEISREISVRYNPEDAARIITDINQNAFKLAMYVPASFSINSMILSPDIKKQKEKLQKEGKNFTPTEYAKSMKEINTNYSKEMESKGYRINDVLTSGVKGDPKVWGSIMISHGYVIDIEGNVRGPITSGITDGYTAREFYDAASEARRGFFYKAAISAEPGYLARRITMANAGIQINEKKEDCGTKHFFNIQVDSKVADGLTGRYYMEGSKRVLITDSDKIMGKNIKLRSPLFCASEKGICPTCFGNAWKELGTTNIGILAGGVINNKALNAYMKLRHQTGTPEIVPVDFLKDLQKYAFDLPALKKWFNITKNEITANVDCFVELTAEDYDENNLIESKDYYLIPGILTVNINSEEHNESVTFPFNYPIKLMKPGEIEEESGTKILKFSPNEKIIHQEFYQKETNVGLINKMFEGQTKYITKPEMLVMSLYDQMPGMDLVYLELIVQNMFRDLDDPTKPARLNNYKSFEIYGQKKLPFITSWLTALSFENPKKAIKTGLLSGQDAEENPLENIVNEKFLVTDDE